MSTYSTWTFGHGEKVQYVKCQQFMSLITCVSDDTLARQQFGKSICHASAVQVGNTFLLMGGENKMGRFDTIFRYEPDTETFTQLPTTLQHVHGRVSATILDKWEKE